MITVSFKRQLGLCKCRVHNAVKKLEDAGTGVIGSRVVFSTKANIDRYVVLWHSMKVANAKPCFGPSLGRFGIVFLSWAASMSLVPEPRKELFNFFQIVWNLE